MTTSVRLLCPIIVSCMMALATSRAQSPPEIVVQAASPAESTAVTAKLAATAATDSIVRAAIVALQQEKAANADTLKRQKALLDQLADLEKAVDELKLFIHRG